MTASDYLYYALILGIPFALAGAVLWAAWGKLDDEFFKRDE